MLASVICFNLFYVFFLEFNIYVFPNIRQAELVVVQPPNCVRLFATMDCSTPGFSVPYCLPEFAQVHVRWIDDAIQPFCSLSPSFLLSSIFLSIRVFPNESVVCIRWLKHWRFNISPSKEYSGLISFKIGWFDLLALQETLKSLL